jgi:hypothetical protein
MANASILAALGEKSDSNHTHPEATTSAGEAGVYFSGQANGSLVFSCAAAPTADLTVNAIFLD